MCFVDLCHRGIEVQITGIIHIIKSLQRHVLLNRWVIEDRGDVKHPMGIEMYLVGLSNGKADVQTTPLGHQVSQDSFRL